MQLRRAAIVSPLRTPVGKFGGGLSSLTAGELGATILKALVERSGIDPERVDAVVFGPVYPRGEAQSIGRWLWFAAILCARSVRIACVRSCISRLLLLHSNKKSFTF